MIRSFTDIRLVNVLFLGLVLFLEVGCATSSPNAMTRNPCEIPPGKNAMQAEQDAQQKSHMIFGEVLRLEDTSYVLKDEDGKEVRLQTDETTEKTLVNKGDRIAANVDDKNHALWIRANRGTDRRTEHASTDCSPN